MRLTLTRDEERKLNQPICAACEMKQTLDFQTRKTPNK